jgi:hypothetical protein
MLWLTDEAVLVCAHELGHLANRPSQPWVTIERHPVLVAKDPEGRSIAGCPNVGAAIKPCLRSLAVIEGYSEWITVEGHAVCLDTVYGLTDGTPPATVKYKVRHAGQPFVEER